MTGHNAAAAVRPDARPDRSWRYAAASVIGSSHVATGLPCQDACRAGVLRSCGPGDVFVAVVADGAGAAQHAALGARAAIDGAFEAIALRLWRTPLDAWRDDDVRGVLTDARKSVAEAACNAEAALREFACTLLLAVVSSRRALFAQIGDGAIVVGDDAAWRCVFWPVRGEYANATSFLTDEDSVDTAQVAITDTAPSELALFSDGLERLVLNMATQTAHAPFFEAMFAPVRSSACEHEDTALSADLADYLGSPAILERTDDDKTLILAARTRAGDR